MTKHIHWNIERIRVVVEAVYRKWNCRRQICAASTSIIMLFTPTRRLFSRLDDSNEHDDLKLVLILVTSDGGNDQISVALLAD